jgi:hypothetical protein
VGTPGSYTGWRKRARRQVLSNCVPNAGQGVAIVHAIPASCGGRRPFRRLASCRVESENPVRRGEERIRNTLAPFVQYVARFRGEERIRKTLAPVIQRLTRFRGEERIRKTLAPVIQRLTRFQDHHLNGQDSAPEPEIREEEPLRQDLVKSEGSPLDNTGPIPAELLKDPSAVDVVPWGFRAAEIERNRTRERFVWMTALVVSWLVTAVTILRLLNVV